MRLDELRQVVIPVIVRLVMHLQYGHKTRYASRRTTVCSVVRLERRITDDGSSRCIMRLCV